MPGEQEIITVFVGCEDCGPTTDVIGLGAPHPAGGPTNWHCREHGRLLERLETVPSARVQELEGELAELREEVTTARYESGEDDYRGE